MLPSNDFKHHTKVQLLSSNFFREQVYQLMKVVEVHQIFMNVLRSLKEHSQTYSFLLKTILFSPKILLARQVNFESNLILQKLPIH